MAHVNYSKQILDSFCEKLEDIATVDKKPKMEGRSMVLFLSQETLVKFCLWLQASLSEEVRFPYRTKG